MVKTDSHKGGKVCGEGGGGGRWTEDEKTQDRAKSSVLQCSLTCPPPTRKHRKHEKAERGPEEAPPF